MRLRYYGSPTSPQPQVALTMVGFVRLENLEQMLRDVVQDGVSPSPQAESQTTADCADCR